MAATSLPSSKAIPPRTSSSNHERKSSKTFTEPVWASSSANMSSQAAAGQQVPQQQQHQQQAYYQHSRTASLGTIADSATWTPAKEKILRGPYEYLLNQPGKDLRRSLIAAFNAWLKVPDQSIEIINRVVAMLHTSSLLVDDVQDSSELRRGIPVTHAIYGVAQTLNSANYMYFVALQELVKLNNPTALHIYTEEMCNLHRGQGMDLFWRDTLTTPTEEDYFEMVGNKTGGLFRLAIKLMQAESPVQKDCVALVGLMGVIFQIRDDYMNLWGSDYTANKGMCEDLTEGKFSFPVIHSIRANPSSLVLINILKQKTKDETVKRYAVGYMDQTGSFAYTRKILNELIERARIMIEELDEGRGEAGMLLGFLKKMALE